MSNILFLTGLKNTIHFIPVEFIIKKLKKKILKCYISRVLFSFTY